MRRTGPLWWWGVRARPGTALTVALLSTIAVATAVSGPLLLRAVQQSAVTTVFGAAPADETSLGVSVDIDPGAPIGGPIGAEQIALSGASSRLFHPSVTVVESVSALAWAPSTSSGPTAARRSRIAVQDNNCAGVRFTAGGCPTAPTEVAVSSADATRLGVTVGSVIPVTVPVGPSEVTPLTVSGAYDAASPGLAVTTPAAPGASAAGISATDLLVSPRSTVYLGLASIATTRRALRTAVTLGDLPTLRHAIAAVQRSAIEQTDTLVVDQGLADVLTGVDRQSHDASTLLWVIELQALALALGALGVVLQRFARARAQEWGVGRLRGMPLPTWLVTVFAEPALPLAAGLPVGFLAGIGCARVAAGLVLRPGTPIEPFRLAVLIAAGIAIAGSFVVLVGTSVRSATLDLAQLLGEVTEGRRTSRLAAVAQTAAVLLAVVSTYQLLAGHQLTGADGRLGLLAPALCALALAVVVVQLMAAQARRATTSPARRLGTLVVVRQLGRTSSTLQRAVVVAVGTAVAVFTTQLAWASSTNQDRLADAQAGAGQVLTVQIPAGADLRQLVDRADPTGSVALAAEELPGDVNGGVSRVVAVDTSRLARVSTWSTAWSGLSAAGLAAALRPPMTAPVMLTGTRVTVSVDSASSVAGPLSQGIYSLPVPQLSITVETGGRWTVVQLGPIPNPTEQLTAELPCARSCRLVALTTSADENTPYDAAYTIAALSTDVTPASAFDSLLRDKGRWQPRVGPFIDPTRPGYASAVATPAGLQVKAHDAVGEESPAIEPTDRPDPLPALLAPTTQTSAFAGIKGAVRGTGLDDQAQLIRPVGRASVLPRSLGDGVLVDLVAAQRLIDPAQSKALDEVWVAPGRHPALEPALNRLAVRIIGRDRLGAAQHELSGQAPTRAAFVALAMALLAALLVLAGLFTARRLDAPARSRDWRSLRVAGLDRRRVRRLAVAEVAGPALLALLTGALAGSVTFLLSVRRLPIRLGSAGPPIEVGPSWTTLVLVVAAGAVLLTATAIATAGLELRAVPAGRSPRSGGAPDE